MVGCGGNRGGDTYLPRPLIVTRQQICSDRMIVQIFGQWPSSAWQPPLPTREKDQGVWWQRGSCTGEGWGQPRSPSDTKVSPGPGAAVVAGAVVGTLVGLGLLAGLVLLYQRQGKVPEEVANDIK